MSEKAIEHYLGEQMKEIGGLSLKYSSGTQTGYPDRICLFPNGLTAWVEVKASGAKPTQLQKIRHARLRHLGQVVLVVDSREAVKGLIEFMMKHKGDPSLLLKGGGDEV